MPNFFQLSQQRAKQSLNLAQKSHWTYFWISHRERLTPAFAIIMDHTLFLSSWNKMGNICGQMYAHIFNLWSMSEIRCIFVNNCYSFFLSVGVTRNVVGLFQNFYFDMCVCHRIEPSRKGIGTVIKLLSWLKNIQSNFDNIRFDR